MKKNVIKSIIYVLTLAIVLLVFVYNHFQRVKIIYPFENALFPPEFPAPAFEWNDENFAGKWNVTLVSDDGKILIKDLVALTRWKPTQQQWDKIKSYSLCKTFIFFVKRVGEFNIRSKIDFQISTDSVNAPVLYRQMPIPFVYAEQHLDSMNFRLIDIGSNESPHYAMKGFMVCGNCHSFTRDGSTIGLDLDAGRRDKGGYFISQLNDTIDFNIDNYMSWTKVSKHRTFGLFSKLSPDGRYIVTTVKDRVVSKNYPYDPNFIPFSQFFFPVNGHLAVYDRLNHKFFELPGANLDEYIQTNAIWTPDGKYIIFSRAKALPLKRNSSEINITDDKIINQYETRKLTFKYSIYRIPFNNGMGGKAEPVQGASDNGKSNYFPAVSPNGKWLIFCQADNFMLLMPDSKLLIVPLEGGKAKKLECNMPLLNSWHSWSPNSKWIVFVSKSLSVYTDMFLSHIDEKGNASVPVLVDKARNFRQVANYPEFINSKADKKFTMIYSYVEITNIDRAVSEGNLKKAKQLYSVFVKQNQTLFPEDYSQLSNLLIKMGLPADAKKYKELSIALGNKKLD